jgi:hypothetical protein
MHTCPSSPRNAQHGVAAIEFALVATILFALLFGIIEFGRLFFTINSVQEITRRAAREQVVRWYTAKDAVQRMAVLRPGSTGTVNFPGAGDITNAGVGLSFHNTYAQAAAGSNAINPSGTPSDNVSNCLNNETNCIRYVRATLADTNGTPFNLLDDVPLDFNVIAPYMPAGQFTLPRSTVIMPAEALGLL